VYLLTAIGQRGKKAAGAFLTVALLSAVAVVGITSFGSEVLAAWKTPANAEPALASSNTFEGLLNFEAPAATVARFDAQKEEAEQSKAQTSNSLLLVKNWKFTQNLLGDAYTQSLMLYQQATFVEALVRFIESSPQVPAFNKAIVRMWEIAFVNLARNIQAIDNALLFAFGITPPPPIPPVSPSF